MKTDLRKYFLTGIATVAHQLGGRHSQPVICVILGSISGLDLVVTLAILLLVGVFVSYAVGRKTAELVDEVLRRIPLSRSIYSIIKTSATSFFSENRDLGTRKMAKFLPDVYAAGFLACRSPSGG
jgi:uncharacterized membrane protein